MPSDELEEWVDGLGVEHWRPLDDHERDLLRRLLGVTGGDAIGDDTDRAS